MAGMPKKIDLLGKTFGDRTVIASVPVEHGQAHWLVRCRCGVEDVVPSQRLRQPGGSSCRRCGRARVDRVHDLTGQIFGTWRVVQRAPTPAGRTSAHWEVHCSCGVPNVVSGSALTSGRTQGCRSCGHLKYEYRVDLTQPDWCWLLGVFHGDGCTSTLDGEGGTTTFTAKPREHQQLIREALSRVGITDGVGVTPNGVNVYSVTLAKDLQRFKVSGVDQEAWMFPEPPKYWWLWAAGLLDADGTVKKNGRVAYYQKPHGGFDFLVELLEREGIRYSRIPHSTRNLEIVSILKAGHKQFLSLVQPRYPKKAARLLLG
jgi:hypothetical protein